MSAGSQPRHPVPGHIPAGLREAFATVKGRSIPPHSPYQRGDAVQMHGYGGYPDPGFRRTGFRGWVVATVGATILTGITTDGQEWWEYWGDLDPDGLPVKLSGGCTCCREEREALRCTVQAAAELQLELFHAGEMMPR